VAGEPSYQTDWVLLENSLLRYSQCPAYGKTTAGLAPWFELYDLTGKLLLRNAPEEFKNLDATNGGWHFHFLATDSHGEVLFSNADQRFSLKLPGLQVRILPNQKPDPELSFQESFHPIRRATVAYWHSENIWLSEMEKSELRQNLSILSVDLKTGKVNWKHTEKVVIGKIVDK